MEKRFEAATAYTPEMYREFSDYHIKGMLRVARLAFLICAAVLALFTTVFVAMGTGTTPVILLSYALVVVLLALPWLVDWIVRRQVEAAAKEVDGVVDTCVFYDDYMTEAGGDSQTTAYYPRLVKAEETEGYFYVCIDRSNAAVISKEAFTLGEPEAFRAFLKEKLGERFTAWEAAKEE